MGRKPTIWIFQATNWHDCTIKRRGNGLERRNLKRETEAAQNISMGINQVRVKTYKLQQSSKCREKDETTFHIVNKCIK